MATFQGQEVLCMALRDQGIEIIFGIVGKSIMKLPMIAQKHGIKYVTTRNEQAAVYAASVWGYLTGRPAVCLVIQGPGLMAALVGLKHAQENGWPLLLITGSLVTRKAGKNAFQEFDEVAATYPYTKYSARPDGIARIPFYIERAVRTSLYGRPGPTYIEMRVDLVAGTIASSDIDWSVQKCPDPPRPQASDTDVARAVDLLVSAEKPLIIVGKGAAYSRAEKSIAELVGHTEIPFLASPMGRGLLPA